MVERIASSSRISSMLSLSGMLRTVSKTSSFADMLNPPYLQRRPDRPRGELLLADAVDLALGFLAGGHRQDFLKNLLADGFHGDAFQDHAGINVHVVEHVVIERRVGGDLDGR